MGGLLRGRNSLEGKNYRNLVSCCTQKNLQDQAIKQISNPAAVNQVEVNIVKSIMKKFGDVITERQDAWVKMMMATGRSSVISE